MKTSVKIGSAEDFRLTRVLLMYGKSDHTYYPPSRPFVTLHEVVRDDEGVRLGEGQLATPQMVAGLMRRLGKALPTEILPEQVLVRTAETIVWWTNAQGRTMFFSDRGNDATLEQLNAKRFPQPPLVFKACGTRLWIRALAQNKRPNANTKLFVAPYWNCDASGLVCTGNLRTPSNNSIEAIKAWEQLFFQSEFTHAGSALKCTRFRGGGVLTMWQSLQGKKQFPSKYLLDATETLATFVTDDDKRHN